MEQREKLIELLYDIRRRKDLVDDDCIDDLADELLANGVVVLPCSDKTWLAMRAGARSIRNNKRLEGAIYCYDPFGESKEIPYAEAANILCEIADEIPEEKERTLAKRKGGDE